MNDLIATVAVILGAALGVLSAVGVLRMPDVYMRLQVAAKASSLGIALLVVGVAAHFDTISVTIRALLVVVFLFLTSPVAAHVIGRAAYLTRAPLAPDTGLDELAGAYDETGHLAGDEHVPGPGAGAQAGTGAGAQAGTGAERGADARHDAASGGS